MFARRPCLVSWYPMLVLGLSLLSHAETVAAAESGGQPSQKALTFEELFGDDVIVRGPGLEIKQSQLDRAFLAYRANLAARGQRLLDHERRLKEAQLLDRMITTFLLTNQATRIDQTLAAGQADRFYEDTRKSANSEEEFERQLRMTGLTPEDFRQRVFEQALAETVLERILAGTVEVDDKEIEEFYETGTGSLVRAMQREIDKAALDPDTDPKELAKAREQLETIRQNNLRMLVEPEKVSVSHVLISTRVPNTDRQLPAQEREEKRKQAEKVLQAARQGEDFDMLIQQFSEDRNLPETSGHYTLSREEPYAPEFKAACFSLQPGQISDLVTTVFGFHIIKLHETIPTRQLSVEEATPRITKFLKQQKYRRAMTEHLRKMRQESDIEILDPKYQLESYGQASTGELHSP